MKIEFDFRREFSPAFGEVFRPVANVILKNKGKEIAEVFYVDSGADSSLIPKSVGDWLGFTLEKEDKIVNIKGITEVGLPVVTKRITMQLGDEEFEVRIAWALIEDVPPLLGRLDIFSRFRVCFEGNRKTIFVKNSY